MINILSHNKIKCNFAEFFLYKFENENDVRTVQYTVYIIMFVWMLLFF